LWLLVLETLFKKLLPENWMVMMEAQTTEQRVGDGE
jgi:hypothetical protein